MQEINKITVLGGGSFGTAIANMIASNHHRVTLWMRNSERAEHCRQQRENPEYLPGYRLDDNLDITDDMAAALAGADMVFFSVPSKSFREVVQEAATLLRPGAFAISTAKGIEEGSFRLMSEILAEELDSPRIGVISGPNLAREIAKGEITATVIASEDAEVCAAVQAVLATRHFRVYANSDRYGVELAGALKNIFAIIAGVASAMALGQNTMSVLITRSLAEMTRFAAKLGADPMTFLGLSGVGDLIVTCSSPLSRNFRVGQALGSGLTLDQAVAKIGQVAEGVKTTKLVKERADQLGVYMPLTSALYDTLYNGKSVREVLNKMMLSSQTDDVEFRVGTNDD